MNKAELVEATAAATKLTKKDTDKTITAVLEMISESLASGEDVTLVGFGTFTVRDRAARTGRNPRTSEPIEIPARRVPVFSAGKNLRAAV